MKILVFEPHKRPRRQDIPNTLENLQGIVGGYIQAIYPWEDSVAVVCDEEGLLKGYELNRYIAPGVVIAGTFLICGLGEEEFDDLPDELADKYEKLLYHPQVFMRTGKGIFAISENGQVLSVV